MKTARNLKKRLIELGLEFDSVYTDNWAAFEDDKHIIGKENTVGIEGDNCSLRHRIRRVFRKTCCCSKKLYNQLKHLN